MPTSREKTSSGWGVLAVGPQEWLQLAQRINQVLREDATLAGVVVTHGTATLEETAHFLHLTVKSDKPVVVTGAMRPPTAVGTDADLNLLDAIRLAACPTAGGRGVLTVLNNEIQSARDVTKMNAFAWRPLRVASWAFWAMWMRMRKGFLSRCDPSAYHGDTV